MNNLTFNHQICQHRPSLEIFAMKFTNDTEDANDLVQDTMVKALRYANLYKQGTNLKAWLYTILKNTFINNYRKNSAGKLVIQVSEELSSHQLKGSASSNQSENTFLRDDISKAMSKLKPEYAVPFLRYFEGFKYYEIAEELDIPIGTVKTRIHMARLLLKNTLRMYNENFRRAHPYIN